MAGEDFPTDLINTTNLRFERPVPSTLWGDDASAAQIAGPIEAIVELKQELVRRLDGEEAVVSADIIMRPDTPNALSIRQKDRAFWTMTPGGAYADEEVLVVEPWSGVAGLEHIRVRIVRRVS